MEVQSNVSSKMSLTDFLGRFGKQLGEKVTQRLKVVYDPADMKCEDEVRAFDERIDSLLRQPFPVQREIIKGVSLSLYRRNRRKLFVCGEMGTGKTTIALSVAGVSDCPMRTLVVCPTHLVEKWKREARQVLPDAKITDLAVKKVITVLQSLRKVSSRPSQHEIFVISKEKAKLGYGWRPAAYARDEIPFCSDCGERAQSKDYYMFAEDLKKKKHVCHKCKNPFWQANSKLRRFAPAEYIKRYLKGFFDLVVLDEIQDYKAGNSLQGKAMGALLSASKRCLCLTGTLNGGYADDLFYLLFRVSPGELKAAGFKYSEVSKWLASYGTLESVRKLDEEDAYYGRGKRKSAMMRKRPGVSPVVIGKHILDKACFIRLSDVIDGLPPYEENVVSLPMDDSVRENYQRLEDDLAKAVKSCGPRVLSSALQALLSYPDSCVLFGENIPVKNKEGDVEHVITAPVVNFGEGSFLRKERELLDLVKKEHSEGRKVLCYLNFTGSRDIRPRLEKILNTAGFRVQSLSSSVPPKKREAWINQRVNDIDVLLVNPELVKTGLDLYDFPTVVFYQVGYNVYTLRQAARRSWRIGQTKPVKVFFFCYESTMQDKAIALIAKKLETALMVEGDLPEGLAEYGSSGDSIVRELGKALVEGERYSGAESAWAIFRKKEIEAQLTVNGQKLTFRKSGVVKDEKSKEHVSVETSVVDDVTIKVTLFEGLKGNKRSVLEVAHDDMDKVLEGKRAQFLLF